MIIPPSGGWPGRVAVGIVRGEPPIVFLAESESVLARLLATEFVAREDRALLQDAGVLDAIKAALLEQRWADCITQWMLATGEVFDGYPDEAVVTSEELDARSPVDRIPELPIFKSGK
jgi:hypothetical protein